MTEVGENAGGVIGSVVGQCGFNKVFLQIPAQELRKGLVIGIVTGVEVRDTNSIGGLADGGAGSLQLGVQGIAKPEEAGAGGEAGIGCGWVIARLGRRESVLGGSAGNPLLREIRLGELRGGEAGCSEAVTDQMMAEIPGVDFGRGLPGGDHIPLGGDGGEGGSRLRGRGRDAFEEPLETDIDGSGAETDAGLRGGSGELNENSGGAGDGEHAASISSAEE